MADLTDYKSFDKKIDDLLRPCITALGFELVIARFIQNPKLTLQVMIERANGEGVNVEDCADVSREISALLDVEDPVDQPYMLEVTSTGVERPLVKIEDYERFKGHVAKLILHQPIQGLKRVAGELKGATDHIVTVATDKGQVEVEFIHIKSARLIFTEKLMKEILAKNKMITEKK